MYVEKSRNVTLSESKITTPKTSTGVGALGGIGGEYWGIGRG